MGQTIKTDRPTDPVLQNMVTQMETHLTVYHLDSWTRSAVIDGPEDYQTERIDLKLSTGAEYEITVRRVR